MWRTWSKAAAAANPKTSILRIRALWRRFRRNASSLEMSASNDALRNGISDHPEQVELEAWQHYDLIEHEFPLYGPGSCFHFPPRGFFVAMLAQLAKRLERERAPELLPIRGVGPSALGNRPKAKQRAERERLAP